MDSDTEKNFEELKTQYLQDIEKITPETSKKLIDREEELYSRATNCTGRWELLGRQVLLVFDMLRDWYKGTYSLPWRSVAAITAALIYFLNPLDIIPDIVPGAGYLDDLVVLSICMKLIQKDLREYISKKNLNPSDFGLEGDN